MGDVPKSVAIYCRISDDRTGEHAGVRRQEVDCQALAERKGWQVTEVYVDNDVSAYSGKPRPSYRRMLAGIAEGKLDGVVVWHLDRLHRQPRELEEFFDTCDRAGVKHLATVTGDVDLATDDGRFHARILGAVARKSSDDAARRIRRKHEELARQGRGSGGGSRPFGFNADRVTLNEAEARHVRDAARRVLAGESLRGIAAEWNRAGVGTVSGKPWSTHVVRRMLIAPRTAGLRAHRGEVVAKACWPAMIDERTHRQLVDLLTDEHRRVNGNPRRYLLTGKLVCGLCGARLVARPRGDGARCYVCASGPGFSGCGKIRALAEPVEQLVADLVLEAVASPDLAAALDDHGEDDDDIGEHIADDERALEQLARDHYVDRVIGRAEYLAARDGLEARLEALRKQRSHRNGTTVLDALSPATLRDDWESFTLERRRAIIDVVLDRVVARPAVRGRNRFDPDRFEPVWRF